METTLYKDGRPVGLFGIDDATAQAAHRVRSYMKNNEMLALCGLCLAPDKQQADAIKGGGKFAPALMAMLGELNLLRGAIARRDAELATLRAENAHLKRALELVDALRNKERNSPL